MNLCICHSPFHCKYAVYAVEFPDIHGSLILAIRVHSCSTFLCNRCTTYPSSYMLCHFSLPNTWSGNETYTITENKSIEQWVVNEGSLIRQSREMVGVVEPQCPVTCSVPLVTSDSLICPFSVHSLHSLCSLRTLYMW